MTSSISKFQGSTNSDAEQRIGDLCAWIRQNCQRRITWEDLTAQSGLTHKELILLFSLHMKTTPMAFIRTCKDAEEKSSQPTQPPAS
jgi:transcriptional regulator GlxA family with amidase domain